MSAHQSRPTGREAHGPALKTIAIVLLALAHGPAFGKNASAGEGAGSDAPAPVSYHPLPVGMTPKRVVVVPASAPEDPARPDATPAAGTNTAAAATKTAAARSDSGLSAASSGEPERLVYSNTLGSVAFAPGAGIPIADDVLITGATGCALRRLEFLVTGLVEADGEGGPFSVDYAVYNTCPGALPPALLPTRLIASGSVELPDDGPWLISPELPHYLLPSTMWLGLTFSRDNAGPVVGAPATVGYSADRFDFPGAACNASFGGFPDQPHASFHAAIWADGCEESRPALHSIRTSGATFSSGVNNWLVDDFQLIGGPCNMTAYEVGVHGAGFYSFELRHACDGEAIPGTERTQIVSSSNSDRRIVRVPIDPPVEVPEEAWFAVRVNNSSGGAIVPGVPPEIGASRDEFGIVNVETCDIANRTAGYDALHLTIFCEGAPPVGACCDPFFKECLGGEFDGQRCDDIDDCAAPGTCEAVCRALPEYNCWFPPAGTDWGPSWVEGETCEPMPFDTPCGRWACCKPDDTCENLSEEDCEWVEPLDLPRRWRLGLYCDDPTTFCPLNVCLVSREDCARARTAPGCGLPACCEEIGRRDRWCRSIEWDPICVRQAGTCDAVARNASCASETAGFGALEVAVGESAEVSNASDNTSVPVSCSTSQPVGPLWFKFTASADAVRLHTCHTDPPHQDTVMTVYSVGNPSTPQSACDSLTEIACVDDAPGCGNGLGADVCLGDLTPGNVYYVQVASASGTPRGLVRFDVETGCGEAFSPERTGTDRQANAHPVHFSASKSAAWSSKAVVDAGLPERSLPQIERGEAPDDPPRPRPDVPPQDVIAGRHAWSRNGHTSVQVNVDAEGNNIPGDAANGPSIAVDPTSPNRIVIGWRQFDSVRSNFREAGWAYSHDAGETWTVPGVLEPGVFRSDPVLAADGSGHFHYYSLDDSFVCQLFSSFDGGQSWSRKTPAFGGDKGWMAIDPGVAGASSWAGGGLGHIYTSWTGFENFARSTDGGAGFHSPSGVTVPNWGTLAVGPDGELYAAGGAFSVLRFDNADDPDAEPAIAFEGGVDFGNVGFAEAPNPGGLLGQTWVAVDRSAGSYRGNVYVLATVKTAADGRSDVVFTRSEDGGVTYDPPVVVHPLTEGWQWFGIMSVAPNGRIDVLWNDTQSTGQDRLSEIRYTYSHSSGQYWSEPITVSPVFDTHLGWPQQPKIGDYYHSISDDEGVNVAYAATFNGEQDIYFLRIPANLDCNDNGFDDRLDLAKGRSEDCNNNFFPDECERDFDGDGVPDECDSDTDGDGVANELDVCRRTMPGRPTNERGAALGDTDEDCALGLADYWRLRNCMQGGRPGTPAPVEACHNAFDRDGSLQIDLSDFARFQREFGSSTVSD